MRFVMAGLMVFILFAGLSANATTMRDLLDGGSLQQGDLQLFDFGGFSSMAIAGARMVTPNQITAATKEDAFGPGLVFDSFASQLEKMKHKQLALPFLSGRCRTWKKSPMPSLVSRQLARRPQLSLRGLPTCLGTAWELNRTSQARTAPCYLTRARFHLRV